VTGFVNLDLKVRLKMTEGRKFQVGGFFLSIFCSLMFFVFFVHDGLYLCMLLSYAKQWGLLGIFIFLNMVLGVCFGAFIRHSYISLMKWETMGSGVRSGAGI